MRAMEEHAWKAISARLTEQLVILSKYDPPMQYRAGNLGICLGALLVVAAGTAHLQAADRCALLPMTQGTAVISDQLPAQDRLTIASLNTAGDPRTRDTLAAWARERVFDVLLLLEVGNRSRDGALFAAALSDRL